MDQAPGPIMARLRPRLISSTGGQRFPGWEKAIQASTMAATTPANGVYKPAMSRRPVPAATTGGTIESEETDHAELMPL